MLAPGDFVTVEPPAEPGRGQPPPVPDGAGTRLREPDTDGTPGEPRPTFLEALRRMLASAHT